MRHRPAYLDRWSAGGLTLLECLIAAAILSIAIAAISQAISSGQAQAADGLHVQRAYHLATALMDEVLCLPNTADGIVSTRSGTKTHVASFHGFAETAGNLKDAANVLYPSPYQKFNRSVTVSQDSINLPGCPVVNGWTVVVTVSETNGRTWSITRFVPAS